MSAQGKGGADPLAAIYGSYNARSVDPREVARGFVAPPQFWQILPQGNTVLTGPRGSGKTTLLKMLQSEALESWPDQLAARARELSTYSGVFVPADRSWSGQISAYGRELEPELHAALGVASFTLHVLRALAYCAAKRIERAPAETISPHDRVSITRSTEEEIALAVRRSWTLPDPVGSFHGLRFALSEQIRELGAIARKARRSSDARAQLTEHPALDFEPIDAIVPFIERFNSAADQDSHVWMFLVDEIEFLPPSVRTDIIGSLRGRDPRIMQKVSLAPYTSITAEREDPLGGWVGHDFQRIDLTFREKENGYEFSEELVARELGASGLPLTPQELLGGSGWFEMPPGASAYAKGSRNAAAINSLARKDPSFREWLSHQQISPPELDEVKGVKRAATLRKAIPIILLRDEFLHAVHGRLERRSRKQPQVYIGSQSAYAICENNPRLLKALVGRLMNVAAAGQISDGERADAVERAAEEYALHLRAIALPPGLPEPFLPRQLVRTIGSYFENCVLGDRFDPEPPLSFELPERGLPVALQTVLIQMIHYGAVVPVEDRRFRLAHMFAPLYRLPLRLGRAHALRSLFSAAALSDLDQLRLGTEEPQ